MRHSAPNYTYYRISPANCLREIQKKVEATALGRAIDLATVITYFLRLLIVTCEISVR
jgi:hypothetical protein